MRIKTQDTIIAAWVTLLALAVGSGAVTAVIVLAAWLGGRP